MVDSLSRMQGPQIRVQHGANSASREISAATDLRMEKIKWSEKVTNEQVLERIGEKRTLLTNILRRKSQLDRSYSEKKLPSS